MRSLLAWGRLSQRPGGGYCKGRFVMVTVRKWLKIFVLAIYLAFFGALLWFNSTGDRRSHHGGLLTIVLFVSLYGLCATEIIEVPRSVRIPFFTVWPRLSDSVKAVVSFALIFLWTPTAMLLTPDTPVGVALILAPDAVFAVASLVFLSNGLSRSTN